MPITISISDAQNKTASMRINTKVGVTAAQAQALTDAVDAITNGTDAKCTLSTEIPVDEGTTGPASDKDADRGVKLLLRVQEAGTGFIYTHEVPVFDKSTLPAPPNDFLDLTTGAGATLKAAFETVYSTRQGADGTLVSAQAISRTYK